MPSATDPTTASAIAFMAQQPLPFEAGSLIIAGDGEVRRVPPRNCLRFRFEHLGIPVEAMVWREPQGAVRVRIDGSLGPLPYTVEGPDRRRRALEVLFAARFMDMPVLLLNRDQEIVLCGETAVQEPVTQVGLISAIVSLVVDVHPFLDLLGEVLAPTPKAA